MATFQYSFQKIVDLKNSEKMQAEWLLSSALNTLTEEEQSLQQLHIVKREWEERLHRASQNAIPLSELQLIGQYLDYLDSCIANKQKDVQQAERHVSQQRDFLTDRMKDEKIWMKAKDHALSRFRQAMQLKEQNELDELATARFMVSTP
ncbi:flagellar export protein FliJ [Paenibacillus chungangensis]|uniref:Flagellar FliJ protein n=1 Tax=Paenibacillus chungangensis TaxID=696535 RepID=A0ABW3HPS9_9BACL